MDFNGFLLAKTPNRVSLILMYLVVPDKQPQALRRRLVSELTLEDLPLVANTKGFKNLAFHTHMAVHSNIL